MRIYNSNCSSIEEYDSIESYRFQIIARSIGCLFNRYRSRQFGFTWRCNDCWSINKCFTRFGCWSNNHLISSTIRIDVQCIVWSCCCTYEENFDSLITNSIDNLSWASLSKSSITISSMHSLEKFSSLCSFASAFSLSSMRIIIILIIIIYDERRRSQASFKHFDQASQRKTRKIKQDQLPSDECCNGRWETV